MARTYPRRPFGRLAGMRFDSPDQGTQTAYTVTLEIDFAAANHPSGRCPFVAMDPVVGPVITAGPVERSSPVPVALPPPPIAHGALAGHLTKMPFVGAFVTALVITSA